MAEISIQEEIEKGLEEVDLSIPVPDYEGDLAKAIEDDLAMYAEPDLVGEIESGIQAQGAQMQQFGDAWEASSERGFDYNFINDIEKELAAQMIVPSDVLGIPVGDAIQSIGKEMGVNPYELWRNASGREWMHEPVLRGMVQSGKMTDRKRQEIVREQSTFTENLARDWRELQEAVPMVLTGIADASLKVGKDLITLDTDELAKDAEYAAQFTGMAIDELAAGAGALGARPVSTLRERPLDTALWALTVLKPAKIAGSAGAFKKAMKAYEAGESVDPNAITAGMKAAKSYYKNTSNSDALRNGATWAVNATPLPTFIKRGWMDLYADTPEPFKALRKMYIREKTADKLILKEKIIDPMRKVMKDIDNPYDAAKLWYALVGNIESIPLRKKAVEMFRDYGGFQKASSRKAKNARTEFRQILNEIDQMDNGVVTWKYDGVPMNSSEFLFDTQSHAIKGVDDVWDSSKIVAEVADNAPAVVRNSIDVLTDVKKHLFDMGADQANIRTSRSKLGSKVLNNSFLAEDMFRATVPGYLPIAKLPTPSNTMKEWFDLTVDASERPTIGMAGAQAKRRYTTTKDGVKVDNPRYVNPEEYDTPIVGKLDPDGTGKNYLTREHFVDSLELSLPKTHDTIARFRFYDDLERLARDQPDLKMVKNQPTKGYTLMDGPVQMERSNLYGGDIQRYGALNGLYVKDDLAKIIKSGERHIRDQQHALDGLFRTHRRLLSLVKHNKLIGNFSTQVNNILGIVQLMAFEGVSPARFFKEYKNFKKGLSDKSYRRLADSGLMPVSAQRGAGDLSGTMKSLKEVKSPTEFAKVMFKDFSDNIPTDGVIKSAISTGVKGTPELALQLMEATSYKLFGANGRMAQFFTAADRFARYGFFKDRLTKLAKRNKISYDKALDNKDLVEDAAQFSSKLMLDYSDLPTGIQMLRETGVAPYIAYPWRASLYYAGLPFRRPKSLLAGDAMRHANIGMDTEEERLRRRSAFPNDMLTPMGDTAKDLMNAAMRATGQEEYEELNVSPRYWTPVPDIPGEMYGLSPNIFTGAELQGKTNLTMLDERSNLAELTGVPLPDPMGLKPVLEAAQGNVVDAAYAATPSYVQKLNRETLWGEDIPKRDMINQAVFGLRTIPRTNREHAFRMNQRKIKKLKGMPRGSDRTTQERMSDEGAALIRGSRGTLY